MSLTGHMENGVIVLDQPDLVPEGAAVRVEVLPAVEPTTPESNGSKVAEPHPFQALLDMAIDLAPDASLRVDEVLYGELDS